MRLKRKKLYRVKVNVADASIFEFGVKMENRLSGISVLTKIMALILLFALNLNGILAIRDTASYYSNTESSSGNVYAAGALDFELDFAADFSPSPILPGESATRTIAFLNYENAPKYMLNATSFSGVLCDYLNLEASLDGGGTLYSGSLVDFAYGPLVFEEPEDWFFALTLPADAPFNLQEETCEFKFVFLGSQTRHDLPLGQGFNDTEEVENTIAAGIWKKVVINKVYYDVDIKHGAECLNEWVEIYNPMEEEIDISGWIIGDNFDEDIIPVSAPIPSLGYAIITGDTSTFDKWEVPDDVVKIVLPDNKIGNLLGNSSDRVILRMPDGTEVDAMSYGEDDYAFDPPCPDVEEGHILGRVPAGYDTDRASDFKDLGLPEVTVLIPNGGEIWYIGRTYTLEWAAMNPNGLDEELLIDIWYSVNSGYSWNNIVRGTENDGFYDWRIPLLLNGSFTRSPFARIKVVANGPENFMIQGWDMSDDDFCPPIDWSLLSEEEKVQALQLLADGILAEADIMNNELADLPETTDDGEELPAISVSGGVVIPQDIQPVAAVEEIATTTGEIIPLADEAATATEEVAATTSGPEEGEPSPESSGPEEIATTTEDIATTTAATEWSEPRPDEADREDIGIIEQIDNIVDEIVNEMIEEVFPETPVPDVADISTGQATEVGEITEITEITEEAPVIGEAPAIAAPEGGADPSGASLAPSEQEPSVESESPGLEEQPVEVPAAPTEGEPSPESPGPESAPDNGEI